MGARRVFPCPYAVGDGNPPFLAKHYFLGSPRGLPTIHSATSAERRKRVNDRLTTQLVALLIRFVDTLARFTGTSGGFPRLGRGRGKSAALAKIILPGTRCGETAFRTARCAAPAIGRAASPIWGGKRPIRKPSPRPQGCSALYRSISLPRSGCPGRQMSRQPEPTGAQRLTC